MRKTKERDNAEEPETEPGQTATSLAETPSEEKQEKTEVREYVDRIKRLQAEFDNYKKRIAREAAALGERIEDRAILDFLPVYDGLHLAFANYNRDKDIEAFVSGIERIFAQFQQVLEQKGISQIRAIGQTFDPAIHEALLSVESEEGRNMILEEFSPGYVRNGRTLRPSKVTVSQGPAQVEEEE
jgi:molecular chaperone GrpE